MKNHYSLLIIGGGPAGLAAATTAVEHGLDVALLDEQPAPGGQIYRAMESIPAERADLLGDEYKYGRTLLSAFRDSAAEYFPNTQVWSLNQKREAGLLHDGRPSMISADYVLLASGAMERPVPFPGWTLPGVMNAGAGQILFKTGGIVPADGVVLAGSGPLLLLLAWQYLNAGVAIKAILDLTPVRNHLRALPYLPRALLAGQTLAKGIAYKNALKKAGVVSIQNVSDLQAHGLQQLESIQFTSRGRQQTIETELLMVHSGIIPQTHLSRTAGCQQHWQRGQQCWHPQVDEWGQSSIDGILIAGDGAGIGGALAAACSGRLAAFQVLHKAGRIERSERDRLAGSDRKQKRRELHIRPFLDAYFHLPAKLLAVPDDDTVVCRCEEVTAGEIRSAVADGHSDSNQVKFLTRCGMGPCQGRQCADAVAHIVAAAGGQPVDRGGQYRVRPPVTPLSLGQLASLYPEETE